MGSAPGHAAEREWSQPGDHALITGVFTALLDSICTILDNISESVCSALVR